MCVLVSSRARWSIAHTYQALDLQSIQSHQWRILPCSAMTGQNLVEGLDWVVGEVAGRLYYSSTDAATGNWKSDRGPQPTQAVVVQ